MVGIGGGITFIYVALQIMPYANEIVTVFTFGAGIFLFIFAVWRTVSIMRGKYIPRSQ